MPTRTEPAGRLAASAAAGPPPARVPGNAWTAIEVAGVGELAPTATVSVVVSGPDPDGHLPLTLAALAGQTYPASLTEVVVEADEPAGLREAAGDVALELAPGGEGPGAAQGDVLVFVTAGSLPERELVEAHARWHHAVADAVSTGTVLRIDATGLGPADVREIQRDGGLEDILASRVAAEDADQAGLETFLERTHGLTERRPDLFRVALRGSLGVRSETLHAAGGPGEARDRRLARLDLAYRLDCAGCVFVPERAARSYSAYAEPWIAPLEPDEAADGEPPAGAWRADPRVASMIPVRGFRPRRSGRVFERPAMVVNVPAEDQGAAEVLGAVDGVLRGHLSDLVVRVQLPDGHPERALVEAACAPDRRVETGPPSKEGRSEAPYQVTMPATAVPDDRTFDAIHGLMTEAGLGVLRLSVPGRADRLPVLGARLAGRVGRRPIVEVVATGPLARARRVAAHQGEPVDTVLARLFGERRLDGGEVGIHRRGASGPEPEPEAAGDGAGGDGGDLAHERAEHLRYRARTATSQARVDRQAQRLFRERLRSGHERAQAERLEARLARVSPTYWVGWKAKRVGRRVAALLKRLWRRVEALRQPVYRVRRAAWVRWKARTVGRRGGGA